MNQSILTAPPREIADYLNHLKDKARERCNYQSDIPGDSNYSEVAYDTWQALYDKVFSTEISSQIYDRFPQFDWYDPDGSYREDVCAFIDAFSEFADKLTITTDGTPLFEDFDEWASKRDN